MSLFVVNTIIIFSFLITVGLTPRTHGHIICKQYIANKRFKILRTYPLMLNLLPPSVFLMDPTISLLLFLLSFFANLFGLTAETPASVTRISVVGAVYCDTCLSNSISKHSYFLPGKKNRFHSCYKVKNLNCLALCVLIDTMWCGGQVWMSIYSANLEQLLPKWPSK